MKQRSLDKEDLQGLNIALDSKQQELQLVCLFFFVKNISLLYHILTPCSRKGNIVLRGPLALFLLSHPRYLIVASPRFSPLLCTLDLCLWSLIRKQIPCIFRKRWFLSRCRHHLSKFRPLGKVNESTEVELHRYNHSPTEQLCALGRTVLLWFHLLWNPHPSIGTPTPSAMGSSLSWSSSARVLERRVKTRDLGRLLINPSPAPSVLEQEEKCFKAHDTPHSRNWWCKRALEYVFVFPLSLKLSSLSFIICS